MGDFVSFVHPIIPSGVVNGKVIRFYTKVCRKLSRHVLYRLSVSCRMAVMSHCSELFLLQEGFPDVYAEVEILLSLDAFSRICHRPTITMYCDPQSCVRWDHTEVAATSDILCVIPAPSTVLTWDEVSATLQQVGTTVGLVVSSFIPIVPCLVTSVPPQEYASYISPVPIKAQAMGLCVVLAPLLLYTDDTSGNRSKKWNKFDQWCFMLAGLPLHENTQLHNIHFITCSNQVSPLDMAKPIVSDLLRLEQGVRMYDAHLQQEVMVVAPILAVLADNPRHSELLNHAGGNANMYCRMCLVSSLMCTLCPLEA